MVSKQILSSRPRPRIVSPCLTGKYYAQYTHLQRVAFEIMLTSLIKQARIKPAADRHSGIMPVLCGYPQTLSGPPKTGGASDRASAPKPAGSGDAHPPWRRLV